MSDHDRSDIAIRMKEYEGVEAQRRLMPLLPAVARIDGRKFSRFTKGMEKPFDVRMTRAMVETTRWLVSETNAKCGYCQSDEISLAWYEPDRRSEIFFAGRIMKMTSQLAAMATVFFNDYVRKHLPEYASKLPTFDCRVWNLPNLEEATNAILWREQDATKNAISSAARCHYSHNELHLKKGSEMQEMLFQKGVNFNDFPAFFKRGTFVQRKTFVRTFDPELDNLPPKHAARQNPELTMERSEVVEINMPPFSRVTNRVGVIFRGEDPQEAKGIE